MKPASSRREIIARRAELMAELFLEEMNPLFLSKPTTDVGYDLLVGFENDKGGVNTVAIAVQATEARPADTLSIQLKHYARIAFSNVPALLLLADVKQNELYYCWLHQVLRTVRHATASVPLTKITESTKRTLETKMRKTELTVAAAG